MASNAYKTVVVEKNCEKDVREYLKCLEVTSNNIPAGQTRRLLYENMFHGITSIWSYCFDRFVCTYNNNKFWHFHIQRLFSFGNKLASNDINPMQ